MTRPWVLVALVGLVAFMAVVSVSALPSYNLPYVVTVTATPDSQNKIPFVVTLNRALLTGEFITFDLGDTLSSPSTGIVPNAANWGCINNQGADPRYNNWEPTSPSYVANPMTGTIVYSISTLVSAGHSPGDLYSCGCHFDSQTVTAGNPIPFLGFMLITFHSTSVVEPIYYGSVTLLQQPTMTSSPAILSVLINPVATGSTLIGTQQLTGSLYRVEGVTPIPVPPHNGSPPFPILPLQVTLNSHIVVTFQSTSDLVFLYWLTALTAYLCPTGQTAPGGAGCQTVVTAQYTGGPAPTSWPAPPIPFGVTSASGATHWGYENPNADIVLETYNNLISFWVTMPTSPPTCASTSCTLQVIVTLTVDAASVHTLLASKPQMQIMAAGEAAKGSFKTMTENGGDIIYSSSADITVTADENAAAATVASTPLLAMLAAAVLALVARA